MTRVFTLTVLAMAGVFAAGCAGASKYHATGTKRAVGADGHVNIEKLEGGNHMVEMEVKHLTPPERLGNDLTTYIVWFQGTDNQPATMAGVLPYDEDDRAGELKATTVLKVFEVFITAEESSRVTAPGSVVVLRMSVEEG